MFSSRTLLPFFVLCIVHGSLSKPLTNNVVEGRGIGSTIWGWITYPFTWWSADVSETLPEKDQPLQTDTTNTYDNVRRQNVNVQCNDQTCTTIRCNKYGCVNITCNIYDTDLTGECRNYNTEVKPEEPTTPNSSESVSTLQSRDKKTDVTSKEPTISTTETSKPTIEDRPLELEAVLSSTVTEIVDKVIATVD
ncbi:uncharacterized protein LOC125068551 [Vanessa atalanta]|uniref:uncharacterized protein LOC125068551 n=1 Tax=Vanessa atalanta TaxID=42275 RepID=UPI001FCD72CB|nr:uncharacterized protein LOC125068551 [Vanessa atalanta]